MLPSMLVLMMDVVVHIAFHLPFERARHTPRCWQHLRVSPLPRLLHLNDSCAFLRLQ